MKKIKKNKAKEIKNLNPEMQLIQMEKFTNDFDKAVKKELKKDIKNLVIILISVFALIVGYFIFNSTLLLILGVGIMSSASIIKLTKDFINNIKNINGHQYNGALSEDNPEEEKSVEQILEEGIGKKEDKDFYTQQYKAIVERVETENERKYREALEKQLIKRKENSNPKLKSVGGFLDKDETMIQIATEIDIYCKAYNIPSIIITDNEWKDFINILYKTFLEKGLESNFYKAISELVRFTFAKVLINKSNEIGLSDFIENLYYLRNSQFETKELSILQKEIKSKIQSKKFIDFTDFVNEKTTKIR